MTAEIPLTYLHVGAPFAEEIGSVVAQKLAPIDLLRMVHWTAQYLWFLPSDPSSARLLPCKSILQQFTKLHFSTLTPSKQGLEDGTGGVIEQKQDTILSNAPGCFSTLQICIRSVLEALAERLGGWPEADSLQLTIINWQDIDCRAQIHPRLLQLCCPLLDQARLALQVSHCMNCFLAIIQLALIESGHDKWDSNGKGFLILNATSASKLDL